MIAIAVVLVVLNAGGLAAQDLGGTYDGLIGGVPTTLVLRINGGTVIGAMSDGGAEHPVRGQLERHMVTGVIGGVGVPLHFHAVRHGDRLRITVYPIAADGEPDHDRGTEALLERRAAVEINVPVSGRAEAGRASVQLDSPLVGTWRKEDITTDPGFAFVSVTEMRFQPNGAFEQYDLGRAGGSGSTSVRAGPAGDVMRADWRVAGEVIEFLLPGTAQWIPVARYYVEDNKLLLTYLESGAREIWYRQ